MDLTLYHSLDAGPRWVEDLFAWPATYLPAVILPIVRADVPAGAAAAVDELVVWLRARLGQNSAPGS